MCTEFLEEEKKGVLTTMHYQNIFYEEFNKGRLML